MMTARPALRYLWVLGFVMLAGSACSFRYLQPQESGNRQDAGNRILIASQSSTFKDRLIAEVIDDLAAHDYFVRWIDLYDLDGEPVEGYDAFFIAYTCLAWHVDSRVLDFLGRGVPRADVFLLTTADSDWQPKLDGIDGITAASRMEAVPALTERIVAEIRMRLKGY